MFLKAQKYMLAQPEYEDVWKDMLATYRKFLFVRHPFQRVLATYRDKVESVSDEEDKRINIYLKKLMQEKYG